MEFAQFWSWAKLSVEAEDVAWARQSKRIKLVEKMRLREEFNSQ